MFCVGDCVLVTVRCVCEGVLVLFVFWFSCFRCRCLFCFVCVGV